jgi:hypothetical protein
MELQHVDACRLDVEKKIYPQRGPFPIRDWPDCARGSGGYWG